VTFVILILKNAWKHDISYAFLVVLNILGTRSATQGEVSSERPTFFNELAPLWQKSSFSSPQTQAQEM